MKCLLPNALASLLTITFSFFALAEPAYQGSYTQNGKAAVVSTPFDFSIFGSDGTLKIKFKRNSFSDGYCNLANALIAFRPYSEDESNFVVIYDAETNVARSTIRLPTSLRKIACSASGKFVLVSSDQGIVGVYSTFSGAFVTGFTIPDREVIALSMSADDRRITMITSDFSFAPERFAIFELESKKITVLGPVLNSLHLPKPDSIQTSPDGKMLAWNYVLSLESGKSIFVPKAENDDFFYDAYHYKFVLNRPVLIVVHTNNKLMIRQVTAYSTIDGALLWSTSEKAITNAYAFSGDGELFAFGNNEGVQVFSSSSGLSIGSPISTPVYATRALMFSPIEKKIAVESDDEIKSFEY